MGNLHIKLTIFSYLLIYCTCVNGQQTLFPNSVVSNDIDFITESDPDAYQELVFLGRDSREMPGDPKGGGLFDSNAFIFETRYNDGGSLEIWCHSAFETQELAQEYVEKLGPRLGKLPDFQRNLLDHVVIHKGDSGAFAEIEGQFFILYSDNMDKRISTHDLEETVFHESVHASYQFMYQNDQSWLSAQEQDNAFVTDYAQDNPNLEDMAESALFAYTLITQPGRLEESIESWLLANIPNRLEWFGLLYPIASNTIDGSEKIKIYTYPNPTEEKCTVYLEQVSPRDQIRVFNLSNGQLMKSLDAVPGNNHIDLSNLPNGNYFLSIKGYDQSIVIKQKR